MFNNSYNHNYHWQNAHMAASLGTYLFMEYQMLFHEGAAGPCYCRYGPKQSWARDTYR